MYKILFLFAVATQAISSPCDHTETSLNCVFYKGTHDGDTIKVDIPNIHPLLGKDVPIRLAYIDAPEINSNDLCERAVAPVAKRRIEYILSSAKTINLINAKRGSFFRIIAEVHVNKYGNLSDLLLKEHLAVPFKSTTDWCGNKNYLMIRDKIK